MTEPRLQSTLLGWIIFLAITVSIVLRRDKDLRQKLFILFSGNVTLYYFFSFLYLWRGEPLFERIALGIAILIPQGGLRFFRAFSTRAPGMGRLGGAAAALGVVLLVAVFYPSSLRPAVGPAILAYVTGFMLVAILNLNVQAKEAATRVDAARIRYLVVGGLLALSLQVVDRLDQVVHLSIPPTGLVITIIYLYIISQIVVLYRVLDLYEMMGRLVVLSLMGAALAVIYTGLVFWAGAGFSINAFLASLVILIMFDPLRELVERKISDFFFRERDALDANIGALRRRLAHVIDVEEMTRVLFDGLEGSTWLTHASLYLIDPHGRGFDLRGAMGPAPPLERIEVAAVRRHFKPYLSGSVLLTTTLSQRRQRLLQDGEREKSQALAETLDVVKGMQADVLLAIPGEEQLLGFVSLKDERLKDPFTPEDVGLLSGLAGQLAITVENSLLYQQTKERDRLAALGQMAAGLAHEIRNPLGSIKGAAQVIEELRGSAGVAESHGDLIGVIVEETDRLNRVVSDFLTYARPGSSKPQLLHVNDIVRRTIQLFEGGRAHAADVVADLAEDLPRIKADGERLHQVFLNLMLNAVQALQGRQQPRLEITTRLRTVRSLRQGAAQASEAQRFVEIRFADNGPGLDPETLHKIFIPFFTTKEHGSGLGLAICQRIVRDSGGDIEVRSQIGQGSIFTVVLPAAEE